MQRLPGYLPLACTWLCLTRCRWRAQPHMQRSCPVQLSRISAGVRLAPALTACLHVFVHWRMSCALADAQHHCHDSEFI
jgi:hypothetical protein